MNSIYYHLLPNHAYGHSKYNKKVTVFTDEILDLVKRALDTKNCEDYEDVLAEILDIFESIEEQMYAYIFARGANRSLA